jgi:hypothetical protein
MHMFVNVKRFNIDSLKSLLSCATIILIGFGIRNMTSCLENIRRSFIHFLSIFIALFACVLLSSGILFARMIFGMSIDVYSNILLSSTSFSDIFIALIKCAVLVSLLR